MEGLRDILWDQIEKVQKKEIDLDRAAVIIKGAETIINSFKVETQHALVFGKGKVKELPLPNDQKEIGDDTGGAGEGAAVGREEKKIIDVTGAGGEAASEG